MVYETFELRIQPGPNQRPEAVVTRSLAGDARVEFDLPLGDAEISAFLQQTVGVTRHVGLVTQTAPPMDVRDFGAQLYRAAFGGAVGACLVRSRDRARQAGAGLRIRLRIDDRLPELADLPWEYLYASDLERFLVLSDDTPLVRYLEAPQAVPLQPVSPPLVVLAVLANPSGVQPLAVEQEWKRLQEAVAGLGDSQVRLERVVATWPALQARLRQGPAHVVHFVGHGYFDAEANRGGLLFEDDQGRAMRLPAERFKVLLHDQEALRLVFLNACEGARGGRSDSFAGVAQQLVQQAVPAVVAMQFPVTDRAAIALSREFYRALAGGAPLEAALSEARKALVGLSDGLEWGTPVLFSRSDDNRLVEARSPEELAYLEGVIAEYREFEETYTPLAGTVERRETTAAGPRLKLSSRFMPTEFEKLVEHGFGTERKTERVPVSDLRDAVARFRRLVVLGEPGSGKTTTMRRLAYDYAVAALVDPRAPLPVLVSLGGYTGPETALAYAQNALGALAPYLPTYLKDHRAVLLLDGLNEMPPHRYKERVGRIQTLLDQYPDAMAVVTCRALDYDETLRLQKLEVKPLDRNQQRAYLRRYLDPAEGDKLFWLMAGDEIAGLWHLWRETGGTWEQFWETGDMSNAVSHRATSQQHDLWKQLQAGWLPSLWTLGENPLMLIMLAQVYVDAGTLPQNRGRLFAAFVSSLLEERHRTDPEQWPGSEVVRSSLIRLAYAMQSGGERGTAVDQPWAVKHMHDGADPERLLYLAASAMLLDTSGGRVRFVHQLIQEYFAAVALGERLAAGEDLRRYWPGGWVDPSGWEETVILLAGILPDMNPLLKQLLVVNPPLAARCIAESGGERPAEVTVHGVQQRLVELMTDSRVAIPQRNAAGVAVNFLGDPRRGVGLRADGLPDIEWVLVPEKDPKSGRKEFIHGTRGERRTEDDFWIARYPITYRQFQAFLDAAGGFHNARWWQGLAASAEDQSAAYEQWFRHENHPRDSVTWYHAIAFCRWLTEKARGHPDLLPAELDRSCEWKIILPTEWQWEKSARGHDGREYPWGGDKYKSGYANIDETRYKVGPHYLQKTSAVGMYPQGVSPYGVADLSGNVSEWCLNEYRNPERVQLEGSEYRVLRGGSWNGNPNGAAAPVRDYDHPDPRFDIYGFRVCAVIQQE